jgi:hypothetical protein
MQTAWRTLDQELHFGEIANQLKAGERRVVYANPPEVRELQPHEIAQHGADDVAVRDEQDAPAAVLSDRAPHCLDPSRLHLRDRLAARRRRVERMVAIGQVVGILEQIVVHHPFPSPVLDFR